MNFSKILVKIKYVIVHKYQDILMDMNFSKIWITDIKYQKSILITNSILTYNHVTH